MARVNSGPRAGSKKTKISENVKDVILRKEILIGAAEILNIAAENQSAFADAVAQALACHYIWSNVAKPADIVRGLRSIDSKVKRLRAKVPGMYLVNHLDAITAFCIRTIEEMDVKTGRPRKAGLPMPIGMIRAKIMEFAPYASDNEIEQAVCICLIEARIPFPDPTEHRDRFNKLVFGR